LGSNTNNKINIRNSIFWNNNTRGGMSRSGIAVSADSLAADTLIVSYSTLDGGGISFYSTLDGHTIILGDLPASVAITLGPGNIQDNPLFRNAASLAGPDGLYFTADDGLNLSAGSPAINAGDPNTTGLTSADITGLPRGVFPLHDVA
jgi:hypothetical protein